MREKKENKLVYSYELQEVLDYMMDVLVTEFPTNVLTPEYLIVSILDTKRCHANLILDNYLMSDNMAEIREIYTSVLSQNDKPVVKDKKADFDTDLNRILDLSDEEASKTNAKQIGTEHVLLSILNPENGFRVQEIFKTVGVDYDFIFDKCKETKKPSRRSKKNFINNGGPSSDVTPKPKFTPLKSEVSNGVGSKPLLTPTDNIRKFTTNINALVREGKVDDVIGRTEEINQVFRVLARRKKNNAVLVGGGGVGKTSIVYQIARLIEDGKAPSILDGKEILSINIMSMLSGTHFRGMFEERVKGLFDELKDNKNYILFIDDIHNTLKGSSKERDSDLSGMIGDILSDGIVRVIGTTSHRDYRATIESNPNLAHKFQMVTVEPSTKQEAIEILKNNKKYYEEFHNTLYSDETVEKCVDLAERYITNRCLPDSAFDVIDLSGAHAALKNDESKAYSEMRSRLAELGKERDEALNHGEFERIDALSIEEMDLKRRINELKKGKKKTKVKVLPSDIANTVSVITKVPVSKLTSSEKEKMANLDKMLKESVIGQDDAIEKVCRAIKRNRVGLGSKSHVLLSCLAIGASGVGKTYLAKKLAEYLFGDEKAMIRIDMSEYSEKSSIAKLHGSAPGYVGYDDGGILTNAIKNKPYSVVLLDEIEKADESIYNLFLQVFDEGRLTESNGNVVDCKNCVFILTSNVGAKAAADFQRGTGFVNDEKENNRAIIEKELKKKFAPEFLNRLDNIVYFNSLTDENLKSIVELEMSKFREKIKGINFDIKYGEDVVDFILDEASKERNYGARPIIRLIQKYLEDRLTDLILENDYSQGHVFKARMKDGTIEVK